MEKKLRFAGPGLLISVGYMDPGNWATTDTLIVLGLKGKGFRQIEAIILGLSLSIALCLLAELLFVNPNWHAMPMLFAEASFDPPADAAQ